MAASWSPQGSNSSPSDCDKRTSKCHSFPCSALHEPNPPCARDSFPGGRVACAKNCHLLAFARASAAFRRCADNAPRPRFGWICQSVVPFWQLPARNLLSFCLILISADAGPMNSKNASAQKKSQPPKSDKKLKVLLSKKSEEFKARVEWNSGARECCRT